MLDAVAVPRARSIEFVFGSLMSRSSTGKRSTAGIEKKRLEFL